MIRALVLSALLLAGCGGGAPDSWRVVSGEVAPPNIGWTQGQYITIQTGLPHVHAVWVLTHELSAHVAGLGHLPHPARSSVPLPMDDPPAWEVSMLAQRGPFVVGAEPSLHAALVDAVEFWNGLCGRPVFVVR